MSTRKGVTLLEVVIATVILVIILGPFLKNLIWQAKTTEDTEKVHMATKVLQSVKEELMAVRFKDFVTYAAKYTPDEERYFVLDDMFFPESKKEVINFQEKYRDFDLTGKFKFVQRINRDPNEKTIVSVIMEISWVQPQTGRQTKTLNLTIIDPKS
jgi:prepilin-type N-terminal cleavage/methylation domain-containing protein